MGAILSDVSADDGADLLRQAAETKDPDKLRSLARRAAKLDGESGKSIQRGIVGFAADMSGVFAQELMQLFGEPTDPEYVDAVVYLDRHPVDF